MYKKLGVDFYVCQCLGSVDNCIICRIAVKKVCHFKKGFLIINLLFNLKGQSMSSQEELVSEYKASTNEDLRKRQKSIDEGEALDKEINQRMDSGLSLIHI